MKKTRIGGISKKGGITIFTLLGLVMATIIIVHQNPGPSANPKEELIKKVISCLVIFASYLVFAKWYDKFLNEQAEL